MNRWKLDLIVASFWVGLVVICAALLLGAFYLARWIVLTVAG